MKKIILSLLVVLTTSTLFAQTVCVPGTITSPNNAYILPDSATNFTVGCAGQYYEQILYIKAAKDTVITITTPISGTLTADIDSFVVHTDITNLPSYLTVESVPTKLTPAGAGSPKSNMNRVIIPGDSLACAKISGTIPAGTAAGTINLVVNFRVYTSNIHSPDLVLDALIPTLYPGRMTDTMAKLTYYKINIQNPCWPAAVSNLSAYGFELIGAVPNPANNSTTIKFETNEVENYNVKVVNLLGEEVFNKTIKSSIGLNYVTLDASTWSNGVYMYSISNAKNTLTQKLQINK